MSTLRVKAGEKKLSYMLSRTFCSSWQEENLMK